MTNTTDRTDSTDEFDDEFEAEIVDPQLQAEINEEFQKEVDEAKNAEVVYRDSGFVQECDMDGCKEKTRRSAYLDTITRPFLIVCERGHTDEEVRAKLIEHAVTAARRRWWKDEEEFAESITNAMATALQWLRRKAQ